MANFWEGDALADAPVQEMEPVEVEEPKKPVPNRGFWSKDAVSDAPIATEEYNPVEMEKQASKEYDWALANDWTLPDTQSLFAADTAQQEMNALYDNDPTGLAENSFIVTENSYQRELRVNPYDEDSFEYDLYEKGPVEGLEQFAKEWFNKQGLGRKIPIGRGSFAGAAAAEANLAYQRLNKNDYERTNKIRKFEYDSKVKELEQIYGKDWRKKAAPYEIPTLGDDTGRLYNAKTDTEMLGSYIEFMYESEIRGMSNGAKIVQGFSILPTYMLEFYVSSDLTTLGGKATRVAAAKLIGRQARRTGVGKGLLATVEFGARGLTRANTVFAPDTFGKYATERTGQELGFREPETRGKTLAKAWGDTLIEVMSEEAFSIISPAVKSLNKATLGKTKFLKGWYEAVKKLKPKISIPESAQLFLKKAKWDGFVGEYGEERIGTILRGLTGVDDGGLDEPNRLKRTLKMLQQDFDNIGVEAPVLLMPGAVTRGFGGATKLSLALAEQDAKIAARALLEAQGVTVPDAAEEATEATPEATEPDGTPLVGELVTETPLVGDLTQPQGAVEVEAPVVQVPKKKNLAKANTDAEVTDAISNVTSATRAQVDEDRAAVGLSEIASPERASFAGALQEAKDTGMVNNSDRIAAQVVKDPTPMNMTQTAAVVAGAAKKKREYKEVMGKLRTETDTTEIKLLAAEADRIEGEFDIHTQALRASGTEKGRALVSQKLAVDNALDILAVKARAKARTGRSLTAKEIEKLTKKVEALEAKVAEQAEKIKQAEQAEAIEMITRANRRMAKSIKGKSVAELASRVNALLEAGC